ncbi:MAG: hypothetical protein WC780_02775 [Lentimicrobiaceae bacterium]|jgi:hypothetical protein
MKVSFSGIKARLLSIVLLLSLLILSQFNVFGQEKLPENGYYITLENDTIFGNLTNQDGMYLIFRDSKGKKHKFTPSRIQSFCLNHQEYVPLFINEMNSIRYVAVKLKGYYTLLHYEYIDGYSSYGQMGLMGGAAEGMFKAKNSGYYVIIENEKGYYSLPSSHKLLSKYLSKHFGNDTFIKAEAEKENLSLKSIEPIFKLANELKERQ